jgi:serine/threonine protein kinase
MSILLSSENVVEYLSGQGVLPNQLSLQPQIESKSSKNFNLLVSFKDDRQENSNSNHLHLLVKQELSPEDDLAKEWCVHKLLLEFPELRHLHSQLAQAIHFDRDNAIIVMKYFPEYEELGEFYHRSKTFPVEIAARVGEAIATIHRATFNSQAQRNFLLAEFPNIDKIPRYFARGLEGLKPGIFAHTTKENLLFYKLYQRYPSLQQAVVAARTSLQPICLVHNDLKLDNILLHSQWEQIIPEASNTPIVKIVDWEFFTWGDPAYDLGRLIGSYLHLWLKSFLASGDLDWRIALQLATTPLDLLQPSLRTILQAYCDRFPEILEWRSDFLVRVLRFVGIALIKRIYIDIQDYEPLSNRSICMLQVAKNLLCEPEKSIPSIFGVSSFELRKSVAV